MNDTFRVRSISPDTRLVGWLAGDANDAPEIAAGNGWLAAHGVDARLIPLQHAPGEATGETLARLAQLLPLAGCLTTTADITGALAELLELESTHGA